MRNIFYLFLLLYLFPANGMCRTKTISVRITPEGEKERRNFYGSETIDYLVSEFLISNELRGNIYTVWSSSKAEKSIVTKIDVLTSMAQSYTLPTPELIIRPTAIRMLHANECAIAYTRHSKLTKNGEVYADIKIFADEWTEIGGTKKFSGKLLDTLTVKFQRQDDEISSIDLHQNNLIALSKKGYVFTWQTTSTGFDSKCSFFNFSTAFNCDTLFASALIQSGKIYLGTQEGELHTIDPLMKTMDCTKPYCHSPLWSLQGSADCLLIGMTNKNSDSNFIYKVSDRSKSWVSLKDQSIKDIYPITENSCFAITDESVFYVDGKGNAEKVKDKHKTDKVILLSDGRLCLFEIGWSPNASYSWIEKIIKVYKRDLSFSGRMREFFDDYIGAHSYWSGISILAFCFLVYKYGIK